MPFYAKLKFITQPKILFWAYVNNISIKDIGQWQDMIRQSQLKSARHNLRAIRSKIPRRHKNPQKYEQWQQAIDCLFFCR